VDVDLDHARIGGDGEIVQARIARRGVAFGQDAQSRWCGGVLDGGHQFQPVLGARLRRQKTRSTASRTCAHRAVAHEPGRIVRGIGRFPRPKPSARLPRRCLARRKGAPGSQRIGFGVPP